MGLFTMEGQRVIPNPETLLIEPFSSIWEQDGSPRKDVAFEQLKFIEFYCSFSKSNPFFNYTDISEREAALVIHFKRDVKAESPVLINSAIDFYNAQMDKLPSMQFYRSSLSAARKLAVFFDTFDMKAVNPRTGTPLYKPAEITRALKETSDIIKTLQSLEKQVMQEMADFGKGKGGREINFFER